MTKDFSKYQKLINNFRGKVLKPDFEKRFNEATSNVVKTEKFLLKMELKRLAAPCTRLIDLRGHVDGECRTFEYNDRPHFLDDVAIKVFEESVAAYNGYTFGVYEAVNNTKNNFRVIYEKEKQAIKDPRITPVDKPPVLEKTQYPASLYKLGAYPNRSEERMNYAISLQVSLPNKDVIDATSSDISVNGCKIRFNELQKFKIGDTLELRFTGLESEFHFGKLTTFHYRVCNLQNTDNIQLVGCSRIYSDTQKRDPFKEFLTGFIQGNKRRYKINLDNTINAIQGRSLEHYALPKMNELPIFISDNDGVMQPRYALTCPNNRDTYYYWQNEQRESALNFLITPERLVRLKAAHEEGKSILVFSFIHESKSKIFFYTADEKQLSNDKEFSSQFLGFSADKASFKVTELTLHNLEPSFASYPFTVANSLLVKDQYLNLPPSQDVKDALDNLPYIVVANDITDERMIKHYQLLNYDNIEVSKLKNFGHKRPTSPIMVDEVGVNFKNQRQEMRFKYKTPAAVELPNARLKGFSHDFSMSGLKIELEDKAALSKGDVVHLSFPSLQKITSAFDLKGLPYEIVHINAQKTIINCRVYVEKHQHIGRNFFKLLIDKNKDKLEPDVHELLTPGLGKALRNIYGGSLTIPSLIIQTSGSRYKVEAIASSGEHGRILPHMRQLSDRETFYNLYPLLHNLQATSLMNSTLKRLQATDKPVRDILYISINKNVERIDKAINTRLDSELANAKQKEIFINNALKKGAFYCIQVYLSRTLEPDMDYLNPELSYISSYAIHRGKQIEQDIWSVAGVMQIFDVTHEALFRHSILSENTIDYSTNT